MIYLPNNELEMAMITRNRAKFVAEWLEDNFKALSQRNIRLSIWDSSDNDDTQAVVMSYCRSHECQIRYETVSPSMAVGHKMVVPLLGVKANYVWPVADRRAFFWQEIDEKVLPLLRFGFDSIALQLKGFHAYEKIFTDLDAYSCASISAIGAAGMSMFSTRIFSFIRDNDKVCNEYEQRYAYAKGFAFVGYVYEALARSKGLNVVTTLQQLKLSKQQSHCHWLKDYAQIVYHELPRLCDNLPEVYKHRSNLPRIVVQETQSVYQKWIMQAVIAGGITKEDIRFIEENCILERLYTPEQIPGVKSCMALSPQEAAVALQSYDDGYNDINRQYISEIFKKHIQPHINGRKLIIWGMGVQSQHVVAYLASIGLDIAVYVDKNAANMPLEGGLNVVSPDNIGGPGAYYVIITTRNKYGEMWDILQRKGYRERDFFWIFQGLDEYMKEHEFHEW